MTEIRLPLLLKLKFILNSTFSVESDSNRLIFKSHKIGNDNLILHHEFLPEYEILEVARILAEVYGPLPKRSSILTSYNDAQYLSRAAESSSRFVTTVINLKGSALHKLLVLLSGNGFRLKDDPDLAIDLALAKTENCSNLEEVFTNVYHFNNLKDLYIFPGVSAHTVRPDVYNNELATPVTSLEVSSKIMAFMSKNSDHVTLGDHLKLDLDEALEPENSLSDFAIVNAAFVIIWRSDYKDLAESMTAAELSSLTYLLAAGYHYQKFPVEILRNRSVARSQGRNPLNKNEPATVLRYLSNTERRSLSSIAFAESLDLLIAHPVLTLRVAAPMIYAALAEVLVVKGEGKAYEVARELKHLQSLRRINPTIYKATVALIAEALDPANDDVPFGWFAQMSEHSWVLTSHIAVKEFESKDLMMISL